MATTKNITMKQFNGTDYDTLYPKTVYNQVSGVAPDGYGLGAKTGKLITDGNAALVGGWFYWGNIDTNLPFTYGHLRVDPRLSSASGQILMQTAYSDSYPGCVAQRKLVNGVWKPWEWVNPPMAAGIEYRTTERYQGKPVYVKLVNFGALPNATTKNVEYGDSVCRPIFGYGISTNNSTFPTVNYGGILADSFNSSRVISLWFNLNTVSISCGGDRSTVNAYVFVKYYKTTD